MTLEELVEKFILAKTTPTKSTIQKILGFSAQTLVRRGFTMRDLKSLYKDKTKIEKLCICCSALIVNRGDKYCSHSCAAKINRRKRECNPNQSEKCCLCCKKPLTKRQKIYCRNACQRKYEYDTFICAWLAGEQHQCGSVSQKIRRYLFEKHNHKCARCGWGELNPVTGKPPLEVEHIDGNSSNNTPENLILLCPNCHSLTLTYKALNKGNGRHSRMQRYREGKSY